MTLQMKLQEYKELGIEEGRQEGEDHFASLLNHMIADGRQEDIPKIASDPSYRNEMYKKYNIC